MITLSVIAVAVVLTTCGLGSYLLLRDDQKVISANPSASATVELRDINSRTTDGRLMTATDVFPTAQIVADPSIPPYKRLGNVQVDSNCRVAATSQVGKLMLSLGCNQVIRATFVSPDNAYYLTAGIFNLTDNTAANSAKDQLGKRSTRPTGSPATSPPRRPRYWAGPRPTWRTTPKATSSSTW